MASILSKASLPSTSLAASLGYSLLATNVRLTLKMAKDRYIKFFHSGTILGTWVRIHNKAIFS